MTPLEKPAGKRELDLCTHNQTEGYPSKMTRASDVGLFTETEHSKVRDAFKGSHHVYLPEKDPHCAIVMRSSMFRPVKRDGGWGRSFKIHGSGEGDPTVPDAIRTPSRWVHETVSELGETGIEVAAIVSWWINSWDDPTPDHTTPGRRKLAERADNVMTDRIRHHLDAGRLVFPGGDLNATRKRINFPGVRAVWQGGLDRLFIPDTRGVNLGRTWDGPAVGVGPDMKHKSRHAHVTIDLNNLVLPGGPAMGAEPMGPGRPGQP